MSLSSVFTQSGTSTPPPLIGALLRVPFETVRDRMLAGLHKRGFTDLVAAHLDVFQYPGPENQRPLQLATQTRMTKQALNYLLGQLEQLGYLTREPDNDDQRAKRIRLTPKGHAAIKAIREIVQDVETEWEQQLGPRNFAQLRNLLTQLYAIATPTNDRAYTKSTNTGRPRRYPRPNENGT
jgi:DNA-binding MarR family transcriptional regulator